jgi:hypothetical protein
VPSHKQREFQFYSFTVFSTVAVPRRSLSSPTVHLRRYLLSIVTPFDYFVPPVVLFREESRLNGRDKGIRNYLDLKNLAGRNCFEPRIGLAGMTV